MTKESPDHIVGSDGDRVARTALTWLAEPGNRAVWQFVQSAGAPATLERLISGQLPNKALTATAVATAGGRDPRQVAEDLLRRADRVGARLIVPTDAEWPARLNDLAALETGEPGRFDKDLRPPLCLWVRGDWPLAETLHRSVAVAGSRAATSYGMHVTTEIAYGLAKHDWTVVSGGGFGIDAAAHRATLAAEGRTVAILASGIDRLYPAGNKSLLEQIAETGLLVSEWPPGSEPLRHRFLLRNRTVAAATLGMVLTEAAANSQATHAMRRALALRRAAMVVPGPITSAMSVGGHDLLRSHPDTQLVNGLHQVLPTLTALANHNPETAGSVPLSRSDLEEASAQLLHAVPVGDAVTPEELASRTGLPLNVVRQRLSRLELAGIVHRRHNGVTRPAKQP